MLSVESAARRFIFLCRISTDMTCLSFDVGNIHEAWLKGEFKFKIVAVADSLGCKRHGSGAYFFFRKYLRKCSGVGSISVDYDESGNIVIDVWHLSYYLKEVMPGGRIPDSDRLRKIALNCVAKERNIYIK